jgi:hypothetical protein
MPIRPQRLRTLADRVQHICHLAGARQVNARSATNVVQMTVFKAGKYGSVMKVDEAR